MARHTAGRNKKKRKPLSRAARRAIMIGAGVLIMLVLVGSAIFFVTRFFGNTADDVQKLSYPREYSEYVDKAARDYDLEPALIYAVIRTESHFDPNAKSNVGAYGIMQVMPESFEWLMGLRGEEGKYTADEYKDERCAVAAYNAGFVVGDWLQDPNCSPDGKTLEVIPYSETSAYVDSVEAAKEKYEELYYR